MVGDFLPSLSPSLPPPSSPLPLLGAGCCVLDVAPVGSAQPAPPLVGWQAVTRQLPYLVAVRQATKVFSKVVFFFSKVLLAL